MADPQHPMGPATPPAVGDLALVIQCHIPEFVGLIARVKEISPCHWTNALDYVPAGIECWFLDGIERNPQCPKVGRFGFERHQIVRIDPDLDIDAVMATRALRSDATNIRKCVA